MLFFSPYQIFHRITSFKMANEISRNGDIESLLYKTTSSRLMIPWIYFMVISKQHFGSIINEMNATKPHFTNRLQNTFDKKYIPQFRIPWVFKMCRAVSRFVPSQWETALLCKDVFHWLGASLESALNVFQNLWKRYKILSTKFKAHNLHGIVVFTKKKRTRKSWHHIDPTFKSLIFFFAH